MGASDFSKLPHTSARPLKRKEDYRFLTGAGQYTDDVVLAAQSCHAVFVRSPHAHAKINSINVGCRQGRARRAGRVHRRRCGRRQHQRPALRLAHHQHQRRAHEGAAAPHPGPGQGALCGRPRTMVVAFPAAGARCGRAGGGGLRRAARRGQRGRCRIGRRGRCGCTTLRPTTIAFKWAIGDKGAVDAAFANAAHVTKLDLGQQPPDPQRHGAARRHRQLQPRQRRIHAVRQQPEPARRAAC